MRPFCGLGVTKDTRSSLSGGSLGLLGRVNSGLEVLDVVILGLGDLDEIGHDLGGVSDLDGGTLHNLDLESEHALSEFDVTRGRVNEIVLGLTSGDLVTLRVLLGLCALSTHLTSNDDFATDGTTTAHNCAEDVVGGHTHGVTGEELELEGLDVGGSGEVLVVREGFDGEVDLVVLGVEVVSLLNERLDFLDLSDLLVNEFLALGDANANLSGVVGSANLNASVAFEAEGAAKELVELSLEHTISHKLALGVHLSNFLVGHLYDFD